MPQLEQIDTLLSQIFWLFAAFAAIYFLVSKQVAPKIGSIVDERELLVANDFEKAQHFKGKAEQINDDLKKKLAVSRTEAFKKISDSSALATKLYNDEIINVDTKIKEETSSAEKDIVFARNAALEELRKESSVFVEDLLKKLAGIKVDRSAVELAISRSN